MKRYLFALLLLASSAFPHGIPISPMEGVADTLMNRFDFEELKFFNGSGDTLRIYMTAGTWYISGVNEPSVVDTAINIRGGTGQANTASNVGNGTSSIFKQKTGVDLEFYTLAEGENITLTTEGDSVVITATGGAFIWADSAGFGPDTVSIAMGVRREGSTYSIGNGQAVLDTVNFRLHIQNRIGESFYFIPSSQMSGGATQDISGVVTVADDSHDHTTYLTGNETITLSGDLTGSGETAITATVVDDSHDHVITNIDAFTEAELETQMSDVTALFTNNVTGDVVVSGGTSAISSGVIVEEDMNFTNSPTDNYLCSYNAGGSNFTWVAAGGGASDTALVLSEAAGGDDKMWWSGDTLHILQSEDADTFHVSFNGSYWVLGADGKTIIDSVLVNNYIDFTAVSPPSHNGGRVFYDDDTKALTYYNEETELLVCLGRCLITEVRNNTGSTILRDRAVYINGGIPQKPTVALAKADNINTADVLGVAGHDIETGTDGFVLTSGEIRNINVNQVDFTDGDQLFLSEDTAGAWVIVQPEICVPIGWVENANATTGKILVGLNHSVIDTATVYGLDNYVNERIYDNHDTAATDNNILVANGTKFNSVAMSGDATIDNTGDLTITDVPADIVLLNEIGDPDGNTSIGIGSNNIVFNFANPASNGFELNATGVFAGDLLHVHQHTGNPGSVHLGHFEAVDVDVLPLFVTHAGRDTAAAFEGGAVYMDSLDVDGAVRIAGSITEVDSLHMDSGLYVGDDITVTGTVDGVDVSELAADYATDSTKLDGIEAGADVTDAANVNPVETDQVWLSDSSDYATKAYADGLAHWVFRDSSTYALVSDSSGDTIVFAQDTTGFIGLRTDGNVQADDLRATDNVFVNSDDEAVDSYIYMKGVADYIRRDNAGDYFHFTGGGLFNGTVTVDGLTLGANENITLGAQTLNHDGTDFIFDDGLDIAGDIIVSGTVDGVDVSALDDVYVNEGVDGLFGQPFDRHYFDTVGANDSIKVILSDTATYAKTMVNPFFIGDIEYTGVEKQWQHRTDLDIEDLKFILPDTFLNISASDSVNCWAKESDSANRYKVIHPSPVISPGGLWGYQIWLALSGFSSPQCENPTIRVSNDNVIFELPSIDTTGGFASPPDPLWDYTDVACSSCCTQEGLVADYLSDTKMFLDREGALWVVFRSTHAYSAANLDGNADSAACLDRHADDVLWATGTDNGYEWSTPVRITPYDTLADYQSPMITLMPEEAPADYRMWVVEGLDPDVYDTTENVLVIWESDQVDALWDSIGVANVVPFENASLDVDGPVTPADSILNANYYMWHGDVLPNGADELLFFLTLQVDIAGTDGSFPLYIGTSNNYGDSITMRNTPVFHGDGTDNTWSGGLYKSGACWVDKGNERTIGLYAGGGNNDGAIFGVMYTEGFYYDTLFWESINLNQVSGSKVKDAQITRTTEFGLGLGNYLFEMYCDQDAPTYDTAFFSGYAPSDMWLDTLLITGASDSDDVANLEYSIALTAPSWEQRDSVDLFLNHPDGNPVSEIRWLGSRDTIPEVLDRTTFHLRAGGDAPENDSLKVLKDMKVQIRIVGQFVSTDQWLRFADIQIKGARLWRRGNEGPTGADGGTTIISGTDSTSITDNGISYDNINWRTEYLTFQAVSQEPDAISDSMKLNWYVDRGDTTFVWRDSTWEGSDYLTVKMVCEVPYDFDADSVIFYYLTDGAIDTIHVQVPSDTSGAMPIADSAFAANDGGWSSATLVRAAVPCNRDLSAGEEVRIKFVDHLADDNDRTWMWKVWLKGQRE